jgi:hypothetical protein
MRRTWQSTSFMAQHQPVLAGAVCRVVDVARAGHEASDALPTKRTRIRAGGPSTAGGSLPA